jgi:hypothetical protein
METNRNTDRIFEKMRQLPEEMPHEKIQQFVLAQAAIGIVPVTASKGLAGMSKLFLKFHLNSLAVMTTASSVTLISAIALVSHFHKSDVKANHNSLLRNKIVNASLIPDLTLSVDSPKTATAINNDNHFTYTEIKTGPGTKVTIVGKGDSIVTTVYSPKDTTYAFNYASANGNVKASSFSYDDSKVFVQSTTSSGSDFPFNMDNFSADLDRMSENMARQSEEIARQSEDMARKAEDDAERLAENNFRLNHCAIACSGPNQGSNDSLVRKIEEALVADKLISDPKNYSFSIDGNSVKANGKKLDKTVWEKYKTIIETNSHSKVNRKFEYQIIKDGDNETINVENYED